jgi:hypothetical protein
MILGDIRYGNRIRVDDIHADKECARMGHG